MLAQPHGQCGMFEVGHVFDIFSLARSGFELQKHGTPFLFFSCGGILLLLWLLWLLWLLLTLLLRYSSNMRRRRTSSLWTFRSRGGSCGSRPFQRRRRRRRSIWCSRLSLSVRVSLAWMLMIATATDGGRRRRRRRRRRVVQVLHGVHHTGEFLIFRLLCRCFSSHESKEVVLVKENGRGAQQPVTATHCQVTTSRRLF